MQKILSLIKNIKQSYNVDSYPFLTRQLSVNATYKPYEGIKILHNIPFNKETLIKLEVLYEGGAEVSVTSPSFMDVDDQLLTRFLEAGGVWVTKEHIPLHEYDIYLDCAGELLNLGQPRIGTVELTSTGSNKYSSVDLTFPVLSVDKSRVKLLEASFGTGEAFVRAFSHLTNESIDDQRFMVFGFGKVGRGIAHHLKSFTDDITVVDISEINLKRAMREGFKVLPASDTEGVENIAKTMFAIVTATGVKNSISDNYNPDAFLSSYLANMGGEDEFGYLFDDKDVMCNKKPINFYVDFPTLMKFLDPVFYAHNLGVDLLLKNNYQKGFHAFPEEIASQIISSWKSSHYKKNMAMKRYLNFSIYHGMQFSSQFRCSEFIDLASDYKNKYEIPHYSFQYLSQMNEDVGIKIADLYEAVLHQPNNRFVRAAYDQLAKEVLDQFLFLFHSDFNIKFTPYFHVGEPYENSKAMFQDLQNRHMYFLTTDCGFGDEGDLEKNNVMLRKTDIIIDGYQLLINDMFRIVHDVFGHAAYGYSFGPVGEDFAWVAHSHMFTPLARAAITAETRGQNCWVNFGQHNRKNQTELYQQGDDGWLPPEKRPFASQKMVLLPEAVSGVRLFEKDGLVSGLPIKGWSPFLSVSGEV